jgi:RNA polymerase sigma-70 factor (ECF subfamily)
MTETKLDVDSSPLPKADDWAAEAEVIARVRSGDRLAFTQLMRRHNQRVFRVVRSVLRDPAEAEDAVQDTWLAAFKQLAGFEQRAAFSTWLTRIAIRCAIAHGVKRGANESLDASEWLEPHSDEGPGDDMQRKEMAGVLEQAIDQLPAGYRLVITLRHLERLSTRETATALGVSEENVRVRLHRAHHALRKQVLKRLDNVADDVFSFGGARCDRTISAVLQKLQQ